MEGGKAITVVLGELQADVDKRVSSGAYHSATDVVRAGIRALKREEAAFDEILRQKVEESLNDPRADIPIEEVFERLERKHAERMKAESGEV